MSTETDVIVQNGRRWRRLFLKVGEPWPEGFVFEGVDEETNLITGLAPLENDK